VLGDFYTFFFEVAAFLVQSLIQVFTAFQFSLDFGVAAAGQFLVYFIETVVGILDVPFVLFFSGFEFFEAFFGFLVFFSPALGFSFVVRGGALQFGPDCVDMGQRPVQ